MVLFYTKNIENNYAYFESDEQKHILNSLRKSEGETIHFTDGSGYFYEGIITESSKKSLIVRVLNKTAEIVDFPKIHIAIAPTKNLDRIEWFLEKSIELGISEISLIQCKHSERKVVNMDRLERIAVAAMKQSLKGNIPIINNIQLFEKWIKTSKNGGLIATLMEKSEHIMSAYEKGKDVRICIGPEGGFREDELEMALGAGFRGVSLGNQRLRTETAGLYSVSCVHAKNGMNG